MPDGRCAYNLGGCIEPYIDADSERRAGDILSSATTSNDADGRKQCEQKRRQLAQCYEPTAPPTPPTTPMTPTPPPTVNIFVANMKSENKKHLSVGLQTERYPDSLHVLYVFALTKKNASGHEIAIRDTLISAIERYDDVSYIKYLNKNYFLKQRFLDESANNWCV